MTYKIEHAYVSRVGAWAVSYLATYEADWLLHPEKTRLRTVGVLVDLPRCVL